MESDQMNNFRVACVFALSASLICITNLSGCFTNTEQNDSQIESNQNSKTADNNANLDTNENVSEESLQSSGTISSGLIATQSRGFAIWSQGRFAVTNPDDNQDLVFEVDPENDRTRIWTSFQLEGSAMIAGGLTAQSLASIGDVSAKIVNSTVGNLNELNADSANVGSIDAENAQVTDAQVTDAQVQILSSVEATIETLRAMSTNINTLSSQEGNITNFSSQSIVASSGEIGSFYSKELSSEQSFLKSISFNYGVGQQLELEDLIAQNVVAGAFNSTSIEVDRLTAKQIDAQNITLTQELSAQSVNTQKLETKFLEAQAIQTQTVEGKSAIFDSLSVSNLIVKLNELSVLSSSCNVVSFDLSELSSPDGSQNSSYLETSYVIDVPTSTTAVFLTPVLADIPCPFNLFSNKQSDGTWQIVLRVYTGEGQSLEDLDMQINSMQVMWLAVSGQ